MLFRGFLNAREVAKVSAVDLPEDLLKEGTPKFVYVDPPLV